MNLHIEGMGVYGSLVARRLMLCGINDFTWNDKECSTNAWSACTGAIYPGGSNKFGPDAECAKQWALWHYDQWFCSPHVAPAEFWYSSKSAPHDGGYKPKRQSKHGLRYGALSLHLDAQALVQETRTMLHFKRKHNYRDGGVRIIAHSWSSRLSHYYWGWTRFIKLDYDKSVYGVDANGLAAFYFRPSKVQMAYAYPVGNTGWWYAGSHIIKQQLQKRRSLSIEPKYQKWKELFLRCANGAVEITAEDQFLDGWRPAAAVDDTDWVQSYVSMAGTQHLVMRPLWNSGVRHFPRQWQDLAYHLGQHYDQLKSPIIT
jgi:hypothetical protein